MSTATETETSGSFSREEEFGFLFAQLVMQQTNMAMMLMGKTPHPETGAVHKDVEAARLFIDQLEMLEAKTKSNLSKNEEALLKQALMSLRLAFVEAVDSSPGAASPPKQEASPQPTKPSEPSPTASPQSEEEEEHRKKFSKKY
jgi:hypothetical protein